MLLGVALGALVHPWFLAVAAFAGLDLVRSSFTGFCPAEYVLPGCEAGTATD